MNKKKSMRESAVYTADSVQTVNSRQFALPRLITLCTMAIIIVITATVLIFVPFGGRAYRYTPDTKVLLYHLVSDETYGTNEYLFVREADFEAQLVEIEKLGYKTVFADELHKNHGEKCVAITFDDGYVDNYTNVLPLLEKYDMKATVFLIPDMIGKEGHLTEEQIREMQKSGHFHFGSHTKSHRNVSGLTEAELAEEMNLSKEAIEALTGRPVTALAYPNGVSTPQAELAAANAGYRYAFTTDAPSEPFYENTKLPRSYVMRDTPMADFLRILE